LDAGANPHIEDYTRLDSCDYAKEKGLIDFPKLNDCNPKLKIRAVRMLDQGRQGLQLASNQV
jgi:2-hydroxychromene-2-carboxylate isomerase